MTTALIQILFGTCCLFFVVSAWDLPTLFRRDLADNNYGRPSCDYCSLMQSVGSCVVGRIGVPNPQRTGIQMVEMIERMVCGRSEEISLCVDKKSVACGAEARSRRGVWLRRSHDRVCNGSSFRSDFKNWIGNRYLPFGSSPGECLRGMKRGKCPTGPGVYKQACQAPTEVLGGIKYRALLSKDLRCLIGLLVANPRCSLNDISTVAQAGDYFDIYPGSV